MGLFFVVSVRKNLVALPTPSLMILDTEGFLVRRVESASLTVSALLILLFSSLSAPVSKLSVFTDSMDLFRGCRRFLSLRDDSLSSDFDRGSWFMDFDLTELVV
jgi:hypothetical protein